MKYLLLLPLIVSAPCDRNSIIHILAAVFSCCFVINDELVHANRCASKPIAWLGQFRGMEFALPAQTASLALYMKYQAVYSNLVWKAPAAQFGACQ
jgi:hypothetical protein